MSRKADSSDALSPDISALIYALYNGVADPSTWPQVADLLVRVHGGHSGHLSFVDLKAKTSERFCHTANFTPDWVRAYRERGLIAIDPWVQVGYENPGRVVGVEKLKLAPGELFRSQFYNEWARQFGIDYILGSVFPLGDGNGFQGLVGVHRMRRYGPHDEQQRRAMNAVLPHLRQALRLRARLMDLEIERAASLAALEALRVGVVVTDSTGRVVFANSTALELCKGESPSVRHGAIHLKDAEQNGALLKAIKDASATGVGRGTSPGGLFSVRRSGARPLALRVCPLPERLLSDSPFRPSAFIFLTDPAARPQTLGDWLVRAYGLSAAESRLAQALLNGESVKEYSARTGIALSTGRTLVRRIFARTGHRRQGDFMREVLGNPIIQMNFAKTAR